MRPVDWFLRFCERYNVVAAVLLIFIILLSLGSKGDVGTVRQWAESAFARSEKNEQKIDHLEKEIKKQADKPPVPPVIIIQEKTVHAKPFTDPALLDRARKLRQQQKAADDNR